MKLSSKLPLIIFIIALSALAFYGYPIVSDRWANPQTESSTEKSKSDSKTSETDNSTLPSESAEEIFTEEPGELEEGEQPAEEDTFVQVLPSDCKNECATFQDPQDISYCKQICGLTAPQKIVSGCDAFSDLEKDYCLKDLAISKTDTKICDKIEDSGIKKACKNRLLEDIVDSQMLQQ